LLGLGFTDIFHTWYFYTLEILLCLNLMLCSILRFPKTRKAGERLKRRAQEAALDKPFHYIEEYQKITSYLSAVHFTKAETSNGALVYTKHLMGFYGSFFVHLSILLVLLFGSLVLMTPKVTDQTVMPGEALTLSDRIAVFNKGYIEQIGTPNEVYNFSKTEFVCNFIGDINRLSGPVVRQMIDAGAELKETWHNYIRLERMHVNVEPQPGQTVVSGTVTRREYYGLYIKYYIDIGCQTVKVIEKNDGVRIYEEGQQVSVVIDPRDVMAYPPGEKGAAS
jgi:hypothetical protein